MADTEANTATTQQSTGETHNIMYIWKIPIDKTYIKSLNSILKIAAIVLSLIAFICVASGRSDNCDDSYSSTYNYFEFVSLSAFFTLIIFWMLYLLTLTIRLFMKLVPWPFVDLAYCIFYSVLYLIANIVLAAQSCGKGSNKAGAAFGFFALGCLCGNAFVLFRDWQASRQSHSSTSDTTNKSADYNPDRNMEQY